MTASKQQTDSTARFPRALVALIVLVNALVLAGCQSANGNSSRTASDGMAAAVSPAETLTIREGDVLRVAFPSAQSLDTQQPVRRDGRITLPLVGEVKAAGMTPKDLAAALVELYAPQLVSKELAVTVISSSFAVFVTGAVRQPGKIQSDRPITALEAVMEAGGFDFAKANTKSVVIVRRDEGRMKRFTVDLKQALEQEQSEPFFLRPSDIVYVPEKFSWF